MTVYIATTTARRREIVTLRVCPDDTDLTTGETVNAVVACDRVRVNDIVEVEDLPLVKISFISSVLKVNLKVVRVVESDT